MSAPPVMSAPNVSDAPLDRGPTVEDSAGYVCRSVEVTLPGPHGDRSIVSELDLEVAAGSILTVVGRSGTGKTTLLRVLGGLIGASSGSVRLGGELVSAPPAGVVTVFQDYVHALLPWRTVRRNVELGLEGRGGCPRGQRRARADAALDAVGLTASAEDRPWQLSGGMQQRVQIARALALHPRVLLMDEPFGALDAMTKATLQDELLNVHERTSATIVFITHDIDEAVYLGDRVVVISGQPGRIKHDIAVDLSRPRDQLKTKELPEFLALRHRVHDAVAETPDA